MQPGDRRGGCVWASQGRPEQQAGTSSLHTACSQPLFTAVSRERRVGLGSAQCRTGRGEIETALVENILVEKRVCVTLCEWWSCLYGEGSKLVQIIHKKFPLDLEPRLEDQIHI